MKNENESEKFLKVLTVIKASKIKINRSNKLHEMEIMPMHNFESLIAQQYIQLKIHKDPKDFAMIYDKPNGILNSVWKFEHVKQFNFELKGFFAELKNVCTDKVCPKMSVNQSIFLCQTHGNLLRDCCAIDYFKHTLDWMDFVLHENNFKSFITFHSAFELLESIADKFLKIFWHSYFHHNKLFQKFENKTLLCSRFIYFGTKYNLIYEDFPKFNKNNLQSNLTPTPGEFSSSNDKNEDNASLDKAVCALGNLSTAMNDLSFNEATEFNEHQDNNENQDNLDSVRTINSDGAINIEDTNSLLSIEDGLLTHRTDSSEDDCLSDKLKASPSLKSVYLKKGKYHPELATLNDTERTCERNSEINFPEWLDTFVSDE